MHAPAAIGARLAEGTLAVVGELGFGTGLNFAVTAEVARACGARLHFISFEAHPIERGAFAAIARRRARELPIYAELAASWPPLAAGWHRRRFDDGRILLSVWYGDAAAGLADIRGRQQRPVGAWFLDGFAPDRNPAMWAPALCEALAELSAGGTTVTTFTAAGAVRRALAAAGFEMRRVDQLPHKRHSLAGQLIGTHRPAATHPSHVHVHGTGIAGASVARHLAGAGVAVTAWAGAAGLPAGSAIPAAVQHARLLAHTGPAGGLRAHAWHYAEAFTRDLPGTRAIGALQVGEPGRLARIAAAQGSAADWLQPLSAREASALAGWPVADALYFPRAAVCDLPRLCRALLDHPSIELRSGVPPPGTEPLVMANGAACRAWPGAGFLELADVAGQLDFVAGPGPRLAVVGAGLLVPLDDGRLAVGATYEYRPWDPERARAANLARLDPARRSLGQVRGVRCVSSDRIPVVGALPSAGSSVWVSTGHGSQGAVSAPFAAALLASRMTGDFEPLAREAAALLEPGRFLLRQARRGIRHAIPTTAVTPGIA
jgi:tRNA 5-methylaminomethyl-2-thiouridine biosynthesis bifunctional protein